MTNDEKAELMHDMTEFHENTLSKGGDLYRKIEKLALAKLGCSKVFLSPYECFQLTGKVLFGRDLEFDTVTLKLERSTCNVSGEGTPYYDTMRVE
jgi:hypothetical protein